MAAPIEKTNVITAIVYDFETGGLDHLNCGATQISMHAVRLDTFEVIGKYNSYIQPYNKRADIGKPKRKTLKNKYDDEEEGELMTYDPEALKITRITMDMLHSLGKPLDVVCREMIDFIRENTFNVVASNKPILVGHNPLFDKKFLQQIMLYTDLWSEFSKVVRGDKDFWGNFQPAQLDTIILSQLAFDDDKSISTWKLGSMTERLNIELDDAHDADADVTATREIVRTLTAKMRSNGDGKDLGSLAEETQTKLREHFKI